MGHPLRSKTVSKEQGESGNTRSSVFWGNGHELVSCPLEMLPTPHSTLRLWRMVQWLVNQAEPIAQLLVGIFIVTTGWFEPFAVTGATTDHLTCIRNNSISHGSQRTFLAWMDEWDTGSARFIGGCLIHVDFKEMLGTILSSAHISVLCQSEVLSCALQGEMVWVSLCLKGKGNWGTKGHGLKQTTCNVFSWRDGYPER